MAQWPDEEEQQPGGEPISQDALDALLAASSNTGEIDDSNAFGAIGETEESDLDFGLGEAAVAEPADAAEVLGGDVNAFGAEVGGFGNAGGDAIDFGSFQVASGGGYASDGAVGEDFQRVRDIPLEVTVELGRTKMLIKDILDLSTGSIIELDKVAGEPVDLFANGLLVARGEVIVIDDNFGVRVTEIITAEDRIKTQYEQSLAA